jgi:hypothetical protein
MGRGPPRLGSTSGRGVGERPCPGGVGRGSAGTRHRPSACAPGREVRWGVRASLRRGNGRRRLPLSTLEHTHAVPAVPPSGIAPLAPVARPSGGRRGVGARRVAGDRGGALPHAAPSRRLRPTSRLTRCPTPDITPDATPDATAGATRKWNGDTGKRHGGSPRWVCAGRLHPAAGRIPPLYRGGELVTPRRRLVPPLRYRPVRRATRMRASVRRGCRCSSIRRPSCLPSDCSPHRWLGGRAVAHAA